MQDEYSKRMGELLLQGWTMLDRLCPLDCPVPLLRTFESNSSGSGSKSKYYCVGCKGTFEGENDLKLVSESTPSLKPQVSKSNSSNAVFNHTENVVMDVANSISEAMEENLNHLKATSNLSSLLDSDSKERKPLIEGISMLRECLSLLKDIQSLDHQDR
jgi:uncharacterized Zn finger protein (UPF0148 family)